MHSLRSIASKLYTSKNIDAIRLVNNSLRHVSQAKVDMERLEKIKIPESTSFVQNIFTGEAKLDNYFPYPKLINNEELEFIDMITSPFSKMMSENKFDVLKLEENHSPEEMAEIMQLLRERGSFGIQVPVDYGGLGCNNTQYGRLAEITSHYELGLSIILGAHQSIGYKGLLLFGTPEQKEKYLPSLASGEKLAAFALTEPSAGSDASGIKSKAVLSEDGKYWTLNGSKIYISNGGIADYFTIFAQTPCRTSSGEIRDKVTAFWVPRCEGLTNGPQMAKMGIKISDTTELFFDNVKIPSENVIGQVGDGFKVAMNILNNGRYGMCCALSGTMRRMIEIASEHANTRSQFGNKLASFTGIQEKIARMATHQYVTQSMAYMLSGTMDKGVKDFQLEAAISKIYASDSAWHVVDETLQMLGGMGYMRETGVEKILRDARIFRIFEGANEILRMFVALTGMQYAGGHLREIQRAMKNPVANLGMIFGEGSRRLRRSVGFDAPQVGEYTHAKLSSEAEMLSKNIILFGSAVEHLLIKYTQNIIHEQMLLTRLANSAIDIYTMMVVLSRCTQSLNNNVHSADFELDLTRIICSEANVRIERNLGSLRNNVALKNDEGLRKVAQQILANNGVLHSHPLE